MLHDPTQFWHAALNRLDDLLESDNRSEIRVAEVPRLQMRSSKLKHATTSVQRNQVVSHDQWLTARMALLVKEKEFTRLRDELSRERRNLPLACIEKEYVFDTLGGPATFADLFDERSQLAVYHFMFGPDWEEGCKSCSFWADNFNSIVTHLQQRDVTLIAVSRAAPVKLEAFKLRSPGYRRLATTLIGTSEFHSRR